MKAYNKDTGRIGEEFAGNLLQKKGYTVVKRNFATRFGEIDLICKDGQTTVFVEVKTKKGLDFGSPEEMYTKSKAERVKRMASVYLEGRETNCRIDMVAIVLDDDNQPQRMTHYPNVILW
ncbi:YraN family protein [Candidatus Gottesmanbacteria bacterium]|nr:YraN family protein [Candidatus Gottesmanbacteria bacterium]